MKEFIVLTNDKVVRSSLIDTVSISEYLYPEGASFREERDKELQTGVQSPNRYGVIVKLSTYADEVKIENSTLRTYRRYEKIVIARGLTKKQAEKELYRFYQYTLDGV